MKFIAFSGGDFLRNIDQRTDQKSESINSSLIFFDNATWIAKFISYGGSKPWRQYVKFLDADIVIPEEEQATVKTISQLQIDYPMVLEGDILVGCDCPAFTYFYSYIVTQLDAILPEYSEGRYPKIKNPQLDGTICKHLVSVLVKFFKFSM